MEASPTATAGSEADDDYDGAALDEEGVPPEQLRLPGTDLGPPPAAPLAEIERHLALLASQELASREAKTPRREETAARSDSPSSPGVGAVRQCLGDVSFAGQQAAAVTKRLGQEVDRLDRLSAGLSANRGDAKWWLTSGQSELEEAMAVVGAASAELRRCADRLGCLRAQHPVSRTETRSSRPTANGIAGSEPWPWPEPEPEPEQAEAARAPAEKERARVQREKAEAVPVAAETERARLTAEEAEKARLAAEKAEAARAAARQQEEERQRRARLKADAEAKAAAERAQTEREQAEQGERAAAASAKKRTEEEEQARLAAQREADAARTAAAAAAAAAAAPAPAPEPEKQSSRAESATFLEQVARLSAREDLGCPSPALVRKALKAPAGRNLEPRRQQIEAVKLLRKWHRE